MNIQKQKLAISIGIPLAIGGLSAWLTRSGMKAFQTVSQPPLTPPGWLFPVVWTVLFVLMGVAAYLVQISSADREQKKTALWFYGVQLIFNFGWSILFFNLKMYLFAFVWLIALWVLIAVAAVLFFKMVKAAGWLLAPYLLWVLFAGYLNAGVWLLN